MPKRQKKPKLVPKREPILLRPENDPDTILEDCKGLYDAVLVIGYDKEGFVKDHYTQNLTEPDLNMLIDQYKYWLFMPEVDDD